MAEAKECFICGEHRPHSIETHHIVPQRYGGSDAPENLVDLCSSCHSAIEKLYTDEFYERLGIEEGTTPDSTSVDTTGTTVPANQTKDRAFPLHPVHVERESFGYEITVPQFFLHSAKDILSEELPEFDHLTEKVDDIDLETIRERDRTFDSSGLISVYPEDTRITPPVRISTRTVSTEPASTDQVIHISDWFERYHCGYCHTVYSENEQADLAAHLRVQHRVDDPYLDESEEGEDLDLLS